MSAEDIHEFMNYSGEDIIHEFMNVIVWPVDVVRWFKCQCEMKTDDGSDFFYPKFRGIDEDEPILISNSWPFLEQTSSEIC